MHHDAGEPLLSIPCPLQDLDEKQKFRPYRVTAQGQT